MTCINITANKFTHQRILVTQVFVCLVMVSANISFKTKNVVKFELLKSRKSLNSHICKVFLSLFWWCNLFLCFFVCFL